MMKKVTVLVAAAVLMTSCENTGADNTLTGAGLGAFGGAIIGGIAGGGRAGGVLAGAGIGALAGGAVGAYMDNQERALQQDLAGSGVDLDRQGDNLVLNFPGGVTFATDSSDVRPEFYSTLSEVAQTLNEYPQTVITIVGHTDSTGAADYNQALSERRAQSVSSYLSRYGIHPARLTAYGVGESQPTATNDTADGRQLNRRVEMTIRPYTG